MPIAKANFSHHFMLRQLYVAVYQRLALSVCAVIAMDLDFDELLPEDVPKGKKRRGKRKSKTKATSAKEDRSTSRSYGATKEVDELEEMPKRKSPGASASGLGKTPTPRRRVRGNTSCASTAVPIACASTAVSLASTATTRLKIGTFFSGMETPSIACKQVGLSHRLVYAIEVLPHLRTLIQNTWKPEQVHEDVTNVDPRSLPYCDVVVGGPPCQPYCKGGKNRGVKDSRGPLTYAMIEMVEVKGRLGQPMPKAVVMEQAKTLLFGHKHIYKDIKKRFKKLGFKVTARVMDTKLNGLPQSRERAYVIAYQPVKGRFKWPGQCTKTIPLRYILHRKNAAKINSRPCKSAMNKLRIRQEPTNMSV